MTFLKRGLTACFAAGMALAAFTAQAETVRIATEGAYPPFNSMDASGNLVGFDVDIANALCEEAGLECEIVAQDWDGIIPGLIANKYDAIVASMTITDERREVVDFTNPYYRSPVRFVAAKDSDLDVSPEGLAGKIIGVQAGTVYEPWLSDNYTESEIRAYPTVDEHNADLLSGRIDLIIGDALALLGGFLETDDGEAYEFVGPDLTDPALVGDGIGIAVRQGEDELREALNTAIATIRENGTYAEINARYFAIDIYGE